MVWINLSICCAVIRLLGLGSSKFLGQISVKFLLEKSDFK